MKDIIGKEIYVNVGNLIGSGKMSRWQKGIIKKKYNGWYLVEVGEGERKYRTGVMEGDIKAKERKEREERERKERKEGGEVSGCRRRRRKKKEI